MNANNPNREQALELKAGIFVLIGLVFIAMMAFKFGRLGQGLFQQYYSLTVSFPSADGLIKNSDVQLAGARIGYVAEKPVISTGGSGVTLPLKILDGVKIPKETNFEVGSSGLLGDKFVDIKPTAEFDAKKFDPADPNQVLGPGDTVEGSSSGGLLGGLQTKGEAVLDQLNVEIKKLEVVTDKINTGILSDQNQQNITDTFTNLKGTTQRFDAASKDLDATVLSANQTLGTVNAAAADMHTAIDDAEKTLGSVRDLLSKAQTGNGLIATLLNDPKLTQDLRVFVANLREHGILFYKNRENTPGAAASPSPASRR
jgi:ABC-type transporter Mla subunit MlaD